MVEIGYTVLPEHRRQGLATAIVGELLAFAAARTDLPFSSVRGQHSLVKTVAD